jgi:hypothetical protein
MDQIFGDFIERFPPDRDSLELNFTPSSVPIKKRWRNQRLSAHFVADYLANFIPFDQDDSSTEKRIKETKGAISYIANELLENAMKFNLEFPGSKVKFGICFMGDGDFVAVIFATNYIGIEGATKFQAFIKVLLASDPEEMYIQQVEASAEDANLEISGLGFLTMLNDYGAKLGWQFTSMSGQPEIVEVTTMAQVSV